MNLGLNYSMIMILLIMIIRFVQNKILFFLNACTLNILEMKYPFHLTVNPLYDVIETVFAKGVRSNMFWCKYFDTFLQHATIDL